MLVLTDSESTMLKDTLVIFNFKPSIRIVRPQHCDSPERCTKTHTGCDQPVATQPILVPNVSFIHLIRLRARPMNREDANVIHI